MPDIVNDRQKITTAIKTPLGFFTLLVLVIEAVFIGLCKFITGFDRTILIIATVIMFILIMIIVALMAFYRPTSLSSTKQSLNQPLANGLGEEIFNAVEPYYGDLDLATREEAYQSLCDTISTSRYATNAGSKKFCKEISATVERRAQLKTKTIRIGPVDKKKLSAQP